MSQRRSKPVSGKAAPRKRTIGTTGKAQMAVLRWRPGPSGVWGGTRPIWLWKQRLWTHREKPPPSAHKNRASRVWYLRPSTPHPRLRPPPLFDGRTSLGSSKGPTIQSGGFLIEQMNSRGSWLGECTKLWVRMGIPWEIWEGSDEILFEGTSAFSNAPFVPRRPRGARGARQRGGTAPNPRAGPERGSTPGPFFSLTHPIRRGKANMEAKSQPAVSFLHSARPL